MPLYPYSTPIILTDTIFSAYGGNVGTTTQAQRNASYVIAEERISTAITTFLCPTIVTGTFAFPNTGHFPLDYSRISRLIRTRFIDFEGVELYTANGENSGCINLRNREQGDVDVYYGPMYRSHEYYNTYQTEIVYECGLSSGTSYHPNLLIALTIEADIILGEIIGYGNEGVGDIGIQDFSNQEYSEKRVPLRNTVLGSSPRSMFADKLLEPFRVRVKGIGL